MEKFTLVKKIIARILAFFGFCIFLFITLLILFNTFTQNLINKVQSIPNMFPHKLEEYDFTKTYNYLNNYMGISFDYTTDLNFEESGVGGFSYNEDYGMVSNQGNIMFYNKNRSNPNDYKSNVFHIKLKYGKFNPDSEIWIPVNCGDNPNELNPILISFVNKSEAACLDSGEVNNAKQFDLNGNHYYTFSYMNSRERVDNYFLILKNGFIEFNFFNQSEDLIKNTLSSLKTFEPTKE